MLSPGEQLCPTHKMMCFKWNAVPLQKPFDFSSLVAPSIQPTSWKYMQNYCSQNFWQARPWQTVDPPAEREIFCTFPRLQGNEVNISLKQKALDEKYVHYLCFSKWNKTCSHTCLLAHMAVQTKSPHCMCVSVCFPACTIECCPRLTHNPNHPFSLTWIRLRTWDLSTWWQLANAGNSSSLTRCCCFQDMSPHFIETSYEQHGLLLSCFVCCFICSCCSWTC